MPLTFHLEEPYFEPVERALTSHAHDGHSMVICKVTRSAIDDLYQTADLTEADRRIIFARHRGILEAVASRKYDAIRATTHGPVVVETHDIADYHGKFGEYRRPPRP